MTDLRRSTTPLALAVACLYWLTTATIPAGTWTETATPAQERQTVNTVSYNGQEFLSSFNSARDETRLVLVFSPT